MLSRKTAAAVAAVVIATSVGGWYAVAAGDEDDPAPVESQAHRAGVDYGRVLSKLYDGGHQAPDLTSAQIIAKCARAASGFGTKRQEAAAERLTKREVDLPRFTDAQRREFVAGCSESVQADTSAGGASNADGARAGEPDIHLPPAPNDVPVHVRRQSGAGPSNVFTFNPDGDLYTAAIACTSLDGADVLEVTDSSGSVETLEKVKCDGTPTSLVIRSTVEHNQRLQLHASQDVSWEVLVYSGPPDAVEVS